MKSFTILKNKLVVTVAPNSDDPVYNFLLGQPTYQYTMLFNQTLDAEIQLCSNLDKEPCRLVAYYNGGSLKK